MGMNISRIVIQTNPLDPPAPHFDDEATIVSARRVVPIAKARVVERKRAVLWGSLIILSSAACGALGAIGVNYFENRQPAAQGSAQSHIASPQMSQSRALPTPSNSDLGPKSEAAEGGTTSTSSPESEGTQPASQANDSSAVVASREPSAQPKLGKPVNPPNTEGASDPSRLVRKRRVRPVSQNDGTASRAEKPAKKKRGAGQIQEIFEG